MGGAKNILGEGAAAPPAHPQFTSLMDTLTCLRSQRIAINNSDNSVHSENTVSNLVKLYQIRDKSIGKVYLQSKFNFSVYDDSLSLSQLFRNLLHAQCGRRF